jgi:hypothetical protein
MLAWEGFILRSARIGGRLGWRAETEDRKCRRTQRGGRQWIQESCSLVWQRESQIEKEDVHINYEARSPAQREGTGIELWV